jgi:hypothetical protein
MSFAVSNREFRITKKLTIMIHEQDYSPSEMSEVIGLSCDLGENCIASYKSKSRKPEFMVEARSTSTINSGEPVIAFIDALDL